MTIQTSPHPAGWRAHPGGLMRCCIETLEKRSPDQPVEGMVLGCDWCSDFMRFEQGAWRWIGAHVPERTTHAQL